MAERRYCGINIIMVLKGGITVKGGCMSAWCRTAVVDS